MDSERYWICARMRLSELLEVHSDWSMRQCARTLQQDVEWGGSEGQASIVTLRAGSILKAAKLRMTCRRAETRACKRAGPETVIPHKARAFSTLVVEPVIYSPGSPTPNPLLDVVSAPLSMSSWRILHFIHFCLVCPPPVNPAHWHYPEFAAAPQSH